MRSFRVIPIVIVALLIVATGLWTVSRPISDTNASLVGLFEMTVLCLAAIPAMRILLD